MSPCVLLFSSLVMAFIWGCISGDDRQSRRVRAEGTCAGYRSGFPHHLAGIAPLVVVPTHHLDQITVDDLS